jgi:hypothetical protein
LEELEYSENEEISQNIFETIKKCSPDHKEGKRQPISLHFSILSLKTISMEFVFELKLLPTTPFKMKIAQFARGNFKLSTETSEIVFL